MGWHLRKSIGGRYVRINLGKKGITSATFGERGAPHITTGKNGTRVGASIPGTGLYYTEKIGGQPSTATQQFPSAPASKSQTQTATLPPNTPPPSPTTPPAGGWKPWSRLVIAALVGGAIAVVLSIFSSTAPFAGLLAFVSLMLGIAGFIVIVVKHSRRNTATALLAIVLSVAGFVSAASHTPGANPVGAATAQSQSSKSSQSSTTVDPVLTSAKATLTGKLKAANSLLAASNGKVSDAQTLAALTAAIHNAAAVNSNIAGDYTGSTASLQSAMDKVSASVRAKLAASTPAPVTHSPQQAPAPASTAPAPQPTVMPAQPAPAPTQQPAQPQATTNPNGSLYAICADGTQSVSSPGAGGYRGMCSHHRGIAQKLGRR